MGCASKAGEVDFCSGPIPLGGRTLAALSLCPHPSSPGMQVLGGCVTPSLVLLLVGKYQPNMYPRERICGGDRHLEGTSSTYLLCVLKGMKLWEGWSLWLSNFPPSYCWMEKRGCNTFLALFLRKSPQRFSLVGEGCWVCLSASFLPDRLQLLAEESHGLPVAETDGKLSIQ